jgi:hypothetical protein
VFNVSLIHECKLLTRDEYDDEFVIYTVDNYVKICKLLIAECCLSSEKLRRNILGFNFGFKFKRKIIEFHARWIFIASLFIHHAMLSYAIHVSQKVVYAWFLPYNPKLLLIFFHINLFSPSLNMPNPKDNTSMMFSDPLNQLGYSW